MWLKNGVLDNNNPAYSQDSTKTVFHAAPRYIPNHGEHSVNRHTGYVYNGPLKDSEGPMLVDRHGAESVES